MTIGLATDFKPILLGYNRAPGRQLLLLLRCRFAHVRAAGGNSRDEEHRAEEKLHRMIVTHLDALW